MDELDETLPLDEANQNKGKVDAEYHNHHRRYIGVEDVGAGGTGKVVKVVDPNLRREVALKFLKEEHNSSFENRTRFIREAQIMAQIEHPNILPVYELGLDSEENLYYTMKYIEGSALSEILQEIKKGDSDTIKSFGQARLLDIFLDICQGVAFSHSNRVIHRDLKPANIVIGSFGEVQILDWGLAKVLLKNNNDERNGSLGTHKSLADAHIKKDEFDLTMNDVVIGTPIYMSPEQAKGHTAAIDERSDIYTLGCILYELLTHEVTINADSIQEAFRQITTVTPIQPKTLKPRFKISAELNAICMKSLSKNVSDRYQSVNEMIKDIHELKEGRSVSAYSASPIERFFRLCKRHPAISSTILGVLMVGMISLGTMKMAFNMHMNKMMAMANNHFEKGNSIYEKKIDLVNKINNLKEAHQNSSELLAWKKNLHKLHKHCESNYEVAFALYSHFAPNRFKTEKNNAIKKIFSNRIRYHLKIKEIDEAKSNLEQFIKWGQKHYAQKEIRAFEKKLSEYN